MLVENWGAVARQGVLTTRQMVLVVLIQLVDVRRPRFIDLVREGTTGELSLPMIPDLDWSRFLLTGGKYMIPSDWILQVQCNYWSGNFKPELVFTLYV